MTRSWTAVFFAATALGVAGVAMVIWPISDWTRPNTAPSNNVTAEAVDLPIRQFGEARLIELVPEIATPIDIAEPAAEVAPILSRPTLLGIVRQNGELTAWLAFGQGVSRSVDLGDEIEGWRVTEISETGLVLESDERREVLSLFDAP